MGRIKQGLDYFPLNTDFMHDRVVRRVMKREGDSAFTILLYTLSYLYSGEGYYIHVDDDFYDELSDQLFCTDNDNVRQVLRLFVEYGFFDSSLYERYGILTSADIQRQFLFVTKRRCRRFHRNYFSVRLHTVRREGYDKGEGSPTVRKGCADARRQELASGQYPTGSVRVSSSPVFC